MKINIAPNADQIRFYANGVLHAWDFHDADSAREQAISNTRALLAYLDACDKGNGVVVVGVREIEGGVRLEVSRGQQKAVDLTQRYFSDSASVHSGDHQFAAAGAIENVRLESDRGMIDRELDLAPLNECGADS